MSIKLNKNAIKVKDNNGNWIEVDAIGQQQYDDSELIKLLNKKVDIEDMTSIVSDISDATNLIEEVKTNLNEKVNTSDLPNITVGNANTVNNHTVNSDVPADAIFTDTLITESDVTGWGFTKNTGDYTKPESGIPASDLAEGVIPTTLPASDVSSWAKQPNKPSYTASEVGAVPSTAIGAASGVASLDDKGKVPSSQLPSYVDDVLEYNNKTEFPETGESGKIYIDDDTNLSYRWSGSSYVEISPSLALGETSSTAYAGDKGATLANTVSSHIENTNNPHSVTKEQVGLGNVENKSSETIRGELTKANVTTALGYTPPESDTVITENDVAGWGFTKNTGDYTKPETGIPASDLASGVIPITLPANGGNADTVNNHTVESDVPSDAVFTDTVITENDVAGWGFTKNTGTYIKPESGIPASDLASGVIPTTLPANGGNADTLGGISLSDFIFSHNVLHSDDGVLPNDITTGVHTFVSDGDPDKCHPYPNGFTYSILAYNTAHIFVQVAFGSKTGDMKIRTRAWNDTWENLASLGITWVSTKDADTIDGKHASDFVATKSLESGADAHGYYPNGFYKCNNWINAPTGLADTQGVMVVINYGGASESSPGWSKHYWISPHAACNGKIFESSHAHSDPTVPWSEWIMITGGSGGSGGDADTLDGKHASDFSQNLGAWSTGDIKDLVLASTSGYVWITKDVTGMPINSTWWFGVVNADTIHRSITITNISNTVSYTLTYNASINTWYDWRRESDGGNADTLDGFHAESFAKVTTSSKTVYVSTSGNDSTGDGTSGKPWRTVQKAVNECPSSRNNAGGYTVSVAAGTYNEKVSVIGKAFIAITASGAATITQLKIYDSFVNITSNGNFTIGTTGIVSSDIAALYAYNSKVRINGNMNLVTTPTLDTSNGQPCGICADNSFIGTTTVATTINMSCAKAIFATNNATVYVSAVSGSSTIGYHSNRGFVSVSTDSLTATTKTSIATGSLINIAGRLYTSSMTTTADITVGTNVILGANNYGYYTKNTSKTNVRAVAIDTNNNAAIYNGGGYTGLYVGTTTLPTYVRGSTVSVTNNTATATAQVRNIATGTAAPTTSTCPAGALYCKY